MCKCKKCKCDDTSYTISKKKLKKLLKGLLAKGGGKGAIKEDWPTPTPAPRLPGDNSCVVGIDDGEAIDVKFPISGEYPVRIGWNLDVKISKYDPITGNYVLTNIVPAAPNPSTGNDLAIVIPGATHGLVPGGDPNECVQFLITISQVYSGSNPIKRIIINTITVFVCKTCNV
jgi:hypothetical protein